MTVWSAVCLGRLLQRLIVDNLECNNETRSGPHYSITFGNQQGEVFIKRQTGAGRQGHLHLDSHSSSYSLSKIPHCYGILRPGLSPTCLKGKLWLRYTGRSSYHKSAQIYKNTCRSSKFQKLSYAVVLNHPTEVCLRAESSMAKLACSFPARAHFLLPCSSGNTTSPTASEPFSLPLHRGDKM